MAPAQPRNAAALSLAPAGLSSSAFTSSSCSALIVLPPSSILPISFFQSHPFVRYLRRLYIVQQQPHCGSKQLVPYEYNARGIVLPVCRLPSSACARRPLLLLPPASPPRCRRKLAAMRSDNLTLSLCFRWLDVASLLSARRVCRLWSAQSRRGIVGEGRCWGQRDRRDRGGRRRGLLLDNAYVRSLCHSLPFLRGLDLSKPDRLSRCDGITERSMSSIAALSCLTSLSLTHYGRAVTDRSVLHLTRLRRLRSLNLCACRSLTSQALYYLHVSPVAATLTSLDVSSCAGVTDVSYLSSFPVLTSLNLSECRHLSLPTLSSLAGLPLQSLALQATHVSASSLSFLLQSPPALISLELTSCPDIDDGIVSLLSHLSSLRTLRLADCQSLSPLFLPALAAAAASSGSGSSAAPLPSLLYLDVSKLSSVVTEASLALLPAVCPGLQVLKADECMELTTTAALGGLRRLHSLSLNLCLQLSSLSSLSSLRLASLSLWNCSLLRDRDVLPLMSCDWLLHLNVCSCRELTDAVVVRGWLKGGMRRLRRLNVRFCHGISVYARGELRVRREECDLID